MMEINIELCKHKIIAMRTVILVLLLISLGVQRSMTQPPILSDTNNLKKGIYKSFAEFKNNTPSIQFDFKIREEHPRYGYFFENKQCNLYSVLIDKEESNRIGTIYGFCDGEEIYITNEYGYMTNFFDKIEYLGRFIYCEQYIVRGEPGNEKRSLQRNAIDINSGERFMIKSRHTAEEWFWKEPSICEQIRKDNFSNEKELLIEYSEKHPEEIIDEEYFTKFDSILYRIKTDTSYLSYYKIVRSNAIHPIFSNVKVVFEYYNNGLKKTQGIRLEYNNGENVSKNKVGTWYYYYNNGNIKKIENYNYNGLLNGLVITFNREEVKVDEKTYSNGILL
jgi:hypothetical protein